MMMEREYVFWHSGRALLIAVGTLIIGFIGAGAILLVTAASISGTIAASFLVLALASIPWALDRRIRRSTRKAKGAIPNPQPSAPFEGLKKCAARRE